VYTISPAVLQTYEIPGGCIFAPVKTLLREAIPSRNWNPRETRMISLTAHFVIARG